MATSTKKSSAAKAKKPAAKKAASPKTKAPMKKPAAKKAAAPARHAKPVAKAATKTVSKAATKSPKPTSKNIAAPKPAKPAPAAKHPVPATSALASQKVGMAKAVPKEKDKDTITRDDGRYALPTTVVVNLPANYRPAQKEEYMNPKQLAYFRVKLQKWREDLVEESKQTIDNLREEVRDVGDEAERATRETENSLELRTRDRYRKLISKIDKALKRIEEGRYGFCEETDEEIGIERLEARPIATLCLDAQERWEHRQKQMGD
jgi:DnaK suppressor protein